VTDKAAPALNALAREGVRFRNHHSVYCTATNVNGAAIATGVYPERNGIFANAALLPAVYPRQFVDTAERQTIAAGDAASHGNYIPAPTIAELVRQHHGRVAIAGTKSVALLSDRSNTWTVVTSDQRLTIFAAAPMPDVLRDDTIHLLGPMPVQRGATSQQRNLYATRALTDVLWRDGVPEFSLLWSSEPDLSQHNYAPGSPEALAGIKAADDNLALLLHELDDRGARDSTDVLVVSDHGFSTIHRSIDIVRWLNEKGFHAAEDFATASDVVVAGDAGTVLFYVQDHRQTIARRLVAALQRSDFAGSLFARERIAGTFPLDAIHIGVANVPDVVMSFRWTMEQNRFGTPGSIDADWHRPRGQGTHATLSPADVHNTFVAAGPDFRRGFESETPTGNIDIAPTVLHLLGLSDLPRFDGRIVTEAFPGNDAPPAVKQKTLTAECTVEGGTHWQQWLKTSRVGATVYFDSGNAGAPNE
jgi:arylsulfatase A-like enzyme